MPAAATSTATPIGPNLDAAAQPDHRAELPRGADHRRADEGRRLRRRLRVRRLLPRWHNGGFDDGTGCASTGPTPAPPLVPGDYITHVVMPKDATDTRPCNPAGEPKRVIGRQGPVRRQAGCLYRDRARGRRQRRPRQRVHPGDPAAASAPAISTRRDRPGGHAAREPLRRARTCRSATSASSSSQSQAERQRRLLPDDELQTERRCDVEEPGRIIGLVSDDIYFDTRPAVDLVRRAAPDRRIPVGSTGRPIPNGNPRRYNWRLIKTVDTDQNGSYEALLPSTETFNCPIPQGPCPGMYVVVVNDPGNKAQPERQLQPELPHRVDGVGRVAGHRPTSSTRRSTRSRATAATVPDRRAVVDKPELLQVSTAVRARPCAPSDTHRRHNRRITIQGVNSTIGSRRPGGPDHADRRARAAVADVHRAGDGRPSSANVNTGGIVSWTDRQIVLQVPALQLTFLAGPEAADDPHGQGARRLVDDATASRVHVLGRQAAAPRYNPAVVKVAAPTVPATRSRTRSTRRRPTAWSCWAPASTARTC